MNINADQIQRVLNEIFFHYEDSLAQSSLLLEALPTHVGVQLDPEFYIEGAEIHLKCNVRIEVLDDLTLDDNLRESISDVVYDWLRSKDIDFELAKVGIQPENFDWLPVFLVRV